MYRMSRPTENVRVLLLGKKLGRERTLCIVRAAEVMLLRKWRMRHAKFGTGMDGMVIDWLIESRVCYIGCWVKRVRMQRHYRVWCAGSYVIPTEDGRRS